MKTKITQKISSILAVITVLSLCVSAVPAKAYDFDPSFILSNDDINDGQSMNLNEIQSFLSQANSFLSSYITVDIDGGNRFASEVIFNASRLYNINPKWILVTLQKEQSLINSSSPSQAQLDWAMGYAVCDDCSKDDPAIQKFKGFAKQIDRAAARIRYYQDNPTRFNFKAGMSTIIDDVFVSIKNMATAILYNYTPHIHGNQNFWKIWTTWFAKDYPDGSLVQADGDKVIWLIENGRRRAFTSKAALKSYFGTRKALSVSPADLAHYDLGIAIKYPNYSLVRDSQGTIYLLADNQRRKITSKEAFRSLGYNPEEVDDIADEDLMAYEEGRDITADAKYALGRLLQDSKSGGVYYVDETFKYPIVSKDILKANYPTLKITKVKTKQLDTYQTAQKIRFKDGTLVKSKKDSAVYVVSNGSLRLILNEKSFEDLGYNKKDIISTSPEALAIHPIGDPIDTTLHANVSVTANH